jgi:RsiW-degrading membrane proteinase PrsW (M82 family)
MSCGAPMTVPKAEPIDPADILLQTDEPPSSPSAETIGFAEEPAAAPEPPPRKKPKLDVASLPPLTTNDPPLWRRHLHWLLILALIPLAVSLLTRSAEKTVEERLEETLDQYGEDEREQMLSRLERIESLDDILSILPGQKLRGAFLARTSKGHWLMAAAAALIYLAFFMFLAADGVANPIHVLLVGLFTATIGVGFLLLVQQIAAATAGAMLIGRGVGTLIFLVLKLIAYSYTAANDPNNGFFLSFIGFTLGVGLCEELVKTFPLFWHRATTANPSWRSFLIWGLASGAGFGIAEGLIYSARYYNGLYGPGIYLVRFLSCVALHSIWSGSVAILLFLCDNLFEDIESWYEWIFPTLLVIAVPAVLHGLYDTCLKKDRNGVALLVALASFGYLAFLLSRLQTDDDRAAHRAMLREYRRRRAALASEETD